MRLSPLDIQQQSFKRALNGVSPTEVNAFLQLMAGEFEALQRDNTSLREEMERLQERLRAHEERQMLLQETLVAAQRGARDVMESAQKEAQIIVSQAELKADKLVQRATEEEVRILSDIRELKRQRVRALSALRSLLESQLKLVALHEGEAEEESGVPEGLGAPPSPARPAPLSRVMPAARPQEAEISPPPRPTYKPVIPRPPLAVSESEKK